MYLVSENTPKNLDIIGAAWGSIAYGVQVEEEPGNIKS